MRAEHVDMAPLGYKRGAVTVLVVLISSSSVILFIPLIHIGKLIPWWYYLIYTAAGPTAEVGCSSANRKVVNCAG